MSDDTHEKGQAARERLAGAANIDLLALAISDPGAFTARLRDPERGTLESIPRWGARAVQLTLAPHTRGSTDAGPNFCQECTASAEEWVRWPCPLVRRFAADAGARPIGDHRD